MSKKLYRSRKNKIIAGVAGGMAEYFDVDPTVARLVWVIAFLSGGLGLALYIVAWIIIPENRGDEESEYLEAPRTIEERQRSIGIWLIVLGTMILLIRLAPSIARVLWPLALILIGVWLLLRRDR